jgi:hypothetical protein
MAGGSGPVKTRAASRHRVLTGLDRISMLARTLCRSMQPVVRGMAASRAASASAPLCASVMTRTTGQSSYWLLHRRGRARCRFECGQARGGNAPATLTTLWNAFHRPAPVSGTGHVARVEQGTALAVKGVVGHGKHAVAQSGGGEDGERAALDRVRE